MRPARTIVVAALLIAASLARATEIPQAERQSGYSFMTPDTQAMQNDDSANPGMLWVLDGEALWNGKAGAARKACAGCHNDARASM
jgi:sulfur-oxidizing protein SoxA